LRDRVYFVNTRRNSSNEQTVSPSNSSFLDDNAIHIENNGLHVTLPLFLSGTHFPRGISGEKAKVASRNVVAKTGILWLWNKMAGAFVETDINTKNEVWSTSSLLCT